MPIAISRARIIAVLLAVAYIAVFISTYIAFTHERYQYLGFGYTLDWPIADATMFACLAMLPTIWLPTSFVRPSAIFIYIQYYVIYIPALWMLHHSILPAMLYGDTVVLSGVLFVGMMILILGHLRLPLLERPSIAIRSVTFWSVIYAVATVLFVLLMAQIGKNFRLVSLAEIYLLREETSDLIEASGSHLATYVFFWLNGFFLPIIVARGIASSNRVTVLAAVAAYVLLFGVWGSKATLFAPFILYVVNIWAARPPNRTPALMIVGFGVLLTVPALLPFDIGLGAIIKAWWISIVNMRTFGIPGILLVQYADFFSAHELTLGSHVTGVNLFIHYPYNTDVPRTVGFYYYGSVVTSNANFWAQDGLAGFGPAGLVAMSIVATAVLWILDSVTRGLRIRFVVTGLSGILLGFANVSIFTTLLTGGLGLFIFACALMPRDQLVTSENSFLQR